MGRSRSKSSKSKPSSDGVGVKSAPAPSKALSQALVKVSSHASKDALRKGKAAVEDNRGQKRSNTDAEGAPASKRFKSGKAGNEVPAPRSEVQPGQLLLPPLFQRGQDFTEEELERLFDDKDVEAFSSFGDDEFRSVARSIMNWQLMGTRFLGLNMASNFELRRRLARESNEGAVQELKKLLEDEERRHQETAAKLASANEQVAKATEQAAKAAEEIEVLKKAKAKAEGMVVTLKENEMKLTNENTDLASKSVEVSNKNLVLRSERDKFQSLNKQLTTSNDNLSALLKAAEEALAKEKTLAAEKEKAFKEALEGAAKNHCQEMERVTSQLEGEVVGIGKEMFDNAVAQFQVLYPELDISRVSDECVVRDGKIVDISTDDVKEPSVSTENVEKPSVSTEKPSDPAA